MIDARRNCSAACRVWYPVMRGLHRFFIAKAGSIVNEDGKGGIAPDPTVWSSGGRPKRRRVVEAVGDVAMLPGPQWLWVGDWLKWPDIFISAHDVGRWPFFVGALVKLAAFLRSLSWTGEVADLGSGGISNVELLILYERWVRERLRIEDSIPKYRRPGRPISVSAAPSCPDAEKWKLCRYFGSMMRALRGLPGGLGRFIPGRFGANHGRLRHIGWEICCHGLTCRPRKSSLEGFLGDLLSLLGYPSGPGIALLDGTMKLKYHTFSFACRKPSWRLPHPGHVVHILTTGGEDVGLVGGEPFDGSGGSVVFSTEVSGGSDSLRKTGAQSLMEDLRVFYSQPLVGRIMTLWRMEVGGIGGGLPGGFIGVSSPVGRPDREGIG